MNYYRRYVGDYLRDTSRLSMLEHGAYNLLLDYYYAEERPIPVDMTEVYRMVRAILPEERAAIDRILTTFFRKSASGFRHKRVDHEIHVSKQARENGKNGGRPKTEDETELGTGTITGVVAGSGHPPTTNHQPPTTSLQPPEKATPAKAGELAILPTNIPYKEIVSLFNATLGSLPMVRELTQKRRIAIRAAWQASKRRQTLDFWKRYFEECAEDPFLNGEGPYKPPHENWRPSFDFLIRSDQVTKVYERAMHEAGGAT